jgi:hypothetical protein
MRCKAIEHHSLDLTHYHYSLFKLALSDCLIAEGLPMETNRTLFDLMDRYKCTVLNKDSILELIENSEGGMQDFISNFMKICCADQFLLNLINKKG